MEILEGINGLYFLVAITVAGLAIERFAPWRRGPWDFARLMRNTAMNFYGMIILAAIPVLSGFVVAGYAREHNIGLFNLIDTPLWLAMVATIIVIDLAGFLQHRALHQWYFLWRAHRTHHLDKTIDTATSLRFHPFEALFRAFTEAFIVLALGLPPEGIIFSYGVMVTFNVFLHMNIRLPVALEQALSWLIVTPRAHRLHHGVHRKNHESNFGTVLSIWDRLLGTWNPPTSLPSEIQFGLKGGEDMIADTFGNLALDPFRRKPRDDAPEPTPRPTPEPKPNPKLDPAPYG